MTVCIAAITNDGNIVCAADKMLSTGNALSSFEPKMSKKVIMISPCIAAMCAGDMALQAQILTRLGTTKEIAEKHGGKLNVRDIVEEFELVYDQILKERIRHDILAKYDLDQNTFVSNQSQMSDDFIRQITHEINNYRLSEAGIETIIAGIDTSTGGVNPHIYSIKKSPYGNSVRCYDAEGYTTIGVGATHADMQFMRSGFHRHFSIPKAMFLTFMAKKRAEIALGVGKETDMFLLGPTLAVGITLNDILSNYEKLDEMYAGIVSKEKDLADAAFVEMAEIIKGKIPFNPSKYD
jgi:hypothetical protein